MVFDVAWCGGVTEARKTADLADASHVPYRYHNYGGAHPWLASIHLGAAANSEPAKALPAGPSMDGSETPRPPDR